MKNRSIYSQIKHALCECHESNKKIDIIAHQFSDFIKNHYPDIREVKQITATHVQEWLNKSADKYKWQKKTINNSRNYIWHIFDCLKVVYSSVKTDLSMIYLPDQKGYVKVVDGKTYFKPRFDHEKGRREKRLATISKEEIDLLRKSYAKQGSISHGIIAIEIIYRSGLHVGEVQALKAENINLEKKIIEVRNGCSPEYYRDVPIRDKDIDFFSELKEQTKRGYIFKVSTGAISTSVHREMEKVGIKKTGYGSMDMIRNLYCLERMQEEVSLIHKKHPTTHIEDVVNVAWDKVKKELGYLKKNNYGKELYFVCVKDQLWE